MPPEKKIFLPAGSPAAPPPPGPARMAAFRPGALGDVVLTTGVFQHWFRATGVTFIMITRAEFAPLFSRHPAVSRVIGLNPDDLRPGRQHAVFRSLAAELAGMPLLDLHGSLRSRHLALLWQGPVHRYPKHAFARRVFLASGGRLRSACQLRDNVPQRYCRAQPLLREDGNPEPRRLLPRIFLSPEELAFAGEALASLSPPDASGVARAAPLAALHPFAAHPGKTWPPDNWLRFASLLEQRGIAVFWIGTGTLPAALPPNRNFCNRTDPRRLAALLARADVLVSGDSGPMHLACAVRTPVLALFGPTCEEWGFFPAGERDRVLHLPMPCRPCSLHGKARCPRNLACLTGITPEYAADSLKTMLDKARPR
jgi:ADP-heptose:LPS heptosyltransferase